MPARVTRIRLDGYSDASVIEDIFAASLVDVAYVDEVTQHGIFVTPDAGVDLDDPADLEWLTSVMRATLDDHRQHGVRIQLDRAETEQA